MALRDEFNAADVLDSLSWAGLPFKDQVAKLTNGYLRTEGKIRRASRDYCGPTTGTVGIFIKSKFKPAHGKGKATTEAVIRAIPSQREVRDKRAANIPWVWSERTDRQRKSDIAGTRYTVWKKNWRSDPKKKQSPCVVGFGRIGDCFMIVDSGGYGTKGRVYIRHNPTNRVKVVVLKGDSLKSITSAMLRMSPKKALRAVFAGGDPLRFDFKGEGFQVNGALVPWRNVIAIYNGKQEAHQTTNTGNPL